LEAELPQEASETRLDEIHAKLHQLERRDWWLLVAAVFVILLLTSAVVSVSIVALLHEGDRFFGFHLEQALRGLVGLVLLFSVYTLYQEATNRRLHRKMVEQFVAINRLEERAKQFQKLAMLDPLTGLYNRRFAEEHMFREMARSDRSKEPLTLLLLDLNHFKQINDRHGHAAGDLMLKEFAQALKKASRGSDLAVRVGGDEFMLLLPQCVSGQVPVVLNRLAGVTAEFAGEKIGVDFSAGWAEYQPGEAAEELLRRVDEALYANKRSGKVEERLEAQKMQTVGQLAGGVAHDFSNFLMVIRGYADLALDQAGRNDTLRGYLQEIRGAVERAGSLTRQLLAYTRRQPLAQELLDLNLVVADIQMIVRRLIGEGIELETSLCDGLGRIKADKGQLEQVILNLVVNARDAMPNGGKLTLETANVNLDKDYARSQPGFRPGSYVRLVVRDTGTGMDVETQARIFKPFFTTKEGGTGLGLATVHGIVKQYDGYILVESHLGQGTTFTVLLPQAEQAPAPAGSVQASTLPAGDGKKA
jgi:diguanylate cyclase (GGDEF)-like protein